MSKEVPRKCQDHPDNNLQLFCANCSKSACKKCTHFMQCYEEHDAKPIWNAIDAFNKQVSSLVESVDDIKQKLEVVYNSIIDDKVHFEMHVQLCRTAIEAHTDEIVRKVKKEGKKLLLDLENVCKEKTKSTESEVRELESHQQKAQSLKRLITKTTMNKPGNTTTLDDYMRNIDDVNKNIEEMQSRNDQSYPKKVTPTFRLNTKVDDAIIKGLGTIVCVDNKYAIDKDDKAITVTEGQAFEVIVSSLDEIDRCNVAATLIKPSGKTTATDEVEYMGSGEYRIKGRCDKEGDWKMEITSCEVKIKGSPVKIQVEPLGLVHTIENMKEHKLDKYRVTDVLLDSDGCIVVSSCSNNLLKFNKSGKFVGNIKVTQKTKVAKMHAMSNGHILYCDTDGKKVVKCNSKFEEPNLLCEGLLGFPSGLTLNNKTKVMYVADFHSHCILKINVENGNLLGKIGSEGKEHGKLDCPRDVTLTKEGNLMVVDWGNHRIQMFDANGIFIKTLVNEGGINDGIDFPWGMCVISNRPRRLAIANRGKDNVKIFNY
ncbi:tripartite motif-containing protein 2-like [Antedon mediterranea]|uniref:tripartite motif-containing protein 2-like n=1 Tax=Antedon mediterranea TaxID=105859 RepID=UPI003AF51C71